MTTYKIHEMQNVKFFTKETLFGMRPNTHITLKNIKTSQAPKPIKRQITSKLSKNSKNSKSKSYKQRQKY